MGGFAPWLSAVLGAGSFDDGNESTRMVAFLQNGGELAQAFKEVWQAGVRRSGAVVGDGSNAPNSVYGWPIEMAGLRAGSFKLMDKTQKTMTTECEEKESQDLNSDMADLPKDNEVRVA